MITSQFQALEGEHMYSWLVRLYRLSGFPSFTAFQTSIGLNSRFLKSQEVFGDTMLKCVHLLPGNNVENLLSHSSLAIWRLSLPDLDSHQFNKNQDSLVHQLHMNEQLIFNFDTSWHSCSSCRIENMRDYGTTYWHAQHQLPSVYTCLTHSTILDRASTPIKNLFTSVLPHDVEKWHPCVNSVPQTLTQWQAFFVNTYFACTTNNQYASELRRKLEKRLGLCNKSIANRKKICHDLIPSFECSLGDDILNYLFRDHAKPNLRGETNILISFLANSYKSVGVRNPVYWIAVAYWLKDEINLETYDENVGVTRF